MHRQKAKRKYSIDSSHLWVTGLQVIFLYLFFLPLYFFGISPKWFLQLIYSRKNKSEKNKYNFYNSPSKKIFKRNGVKTYLCNRESVQNRDDSQVLELSVGKHLDSRLLCSRSDCFAVGLTGLPTSHCLFFFFFHSRMNHLHCYFSELHEKFYIFKVCVWGGIFLLTFLYRSHFSLKDQRN